GGAAGAWRRGCSYRAKSDPQFQRNRKSLVPASAPRNRATPRRAGAKPNATHWNLSINWLCFVILRFALHPPRNRVTLFAYRRFLDGPPLPGGQGGGAKMPRPHRLITG